MAATSFKSKLRNAGFDIEVINTSIEEIPHWAELVITHENLSVRAKSAAKNAEHISIKDYFNDPELDRLIARLQSKNIASDIVDSSKVEENNILKKSNIKLGLKSIEKEEAIKMAGQLLVDSGYVDPEYVEAMLLREEQLSTYIGKGVAIPHGVGKAKDNIKKSGMVVLQFPEGVSFGEEKVCLLIGIAAVGNEHLNILSNIATALEDDDHIEGLNSTKNVDEIYNAFTLETV